MSSGSEIKRTANNRWRRQKAITHLALANELEVLPSEMTLVLPCSLNSQILPSAKTGDAENSPPIRSCQKIFPLAASRQLAMPASLDHVKELANLKHGGFIRNAAFDLPCHVRVRNHSTAAAANSEQLAGVESRWKENHSNPTAGRVLAEYSPRSSTRHSSLPSYGL
jgi:hypothetical protein